MEGRPWAVVGMDEHGVQLRELPRGLVAEEILSRCKLVCTAHRIILEMVRIASKIHLLPQSMAYEMAVFFASWTALSSDDILSGPSNQSIVYVYSKNGTKSSLNKVECHQSRVGLIKAPAKDNCQN